ncbi:MAG: carboxypeptidase-like regulatory domain-containing protein [Terriglobales bacterium]
MPTSMKRSLFLAFFLVRALSLASAQEPTPAPKISSIAGTVVKEPGSEPLKKVLVQVIAEHQGESYTTATDADGHFRVDNVAPGRYSIFFEKTGFAGVNARGLKSDTNVLTVQAGQSLEDLLFRMSPTAVISGRVTDEDGDPMHEVRVFVQRKKPGKAGREGVGMAGTNDLGEYRLAGLFPGEYWIVAMPPPDFRDYERQREKSPPDGNNADKPDTRYVTTYYPGTYDATQASAIKLKAGDEMPINFTLVPARTYRVRGTVVGVAPGQKSSVELIPKAGDAVRVNADEIGPDGQFEVRGVAPGPYVLRASASRGTQSLTAEQELNVVAADLDGLRLSPVPSFTISGHLHSDGVSDLTQYVVNLRLVDLPEDPGFFMSQDFFGGNATVDRQGNFEWKNVNPGNYIVQVYGSDPQSNYYLKSVTVGGLDVATGFTASGPTWLEALVSSKGGIVEGTVVEKEKDVDDAHPAANATVVAVPEEKYRKIPNRFASGTSDQHGRFSIRGLAPGSYTLYAWLDLEDSVWRDPDFLKSQEANGTAVKVEEGSDQKVELKLSPAGERWR